MFLARGTLDILQYYYISQKAKYMLIPQWLILMLVTLQDFFSFYRL